MVVIRLTRVGKKKQAHYRIVVAESKRAVKGKFISILGWYNPHTKELQVKKDELQAWFDKGAMPSNTLAKLLKKEGVTLPKWVKITEKKKAPKKTEEPKDKGTKEQKTEAKEDAEVEAPADESAEAPVEEVKEEKVEEAPTSNVADAAESKTEEVTEDEKAKAEDKKES